MFSSKALEIIKLAKSNGVGLGGFNFVNMEALQAIVAAANETDSPVMVQASMGAIKYAGLNYIVDMVATAKKTSDVEIILHLDHGDYDNARACIEAGFDGVMFDGSALPDEENVAKTAEIVEFAHSKGVFVEAEIGRIGGTEEHVSVSEEEARYTQADEAAKFIEMTGADILAIAIGTAHGVYHGVPKLRFDLIEEIAATLPNTPLVMHGSSGVPAQDVQQAIRSGITKINIDTDLRQAFTTSIRNTLNENPQEIDLRKYLSPGKKAVKDVVVEKIKTFNFRD
ncbi:MAG: class II fructose-bisphosphate aldolase family protein [Pseudomonadales bacterium]|jgi:fructose-bisphosphate aldolase class II|nr:class II fructose-bisphosphate aldolase family protein [Pseudomonadales bacterium]